MLKISTKTRYALRALLEMACREDKKLFRLGELARDQNISRKYLDIIFSTLRKHHLVCSKVEKNGGLYLSPSFKKLSILTILETLEGKIDIVDCRHEGGRPCERMKFCHARGIWEEINASIKQILNSKNLFELAQSKDIRHKCAILKSQNRK